jgi:hypothetical protein
MGSWPFAGPVDQPSLRRRPRARQPQPTAVRRTFDLDRLFPCSIRILEVMKIDIPSLVEHYAKVRQYGSGIVLVVMNLIPLVGVVFFGWSGFNIVFLYWSENVIIGFFNVLKMLTAGAIGDPHARPLIPRRPALTGDRVAGAASGISHDPGHRGVDTPRSPKSPGHPMINLGRLLALASAIFYSVFFTFHYGLFTYFHGIFVVVLCKVMPAQLAGQPTEPVFGLEPYVKEAFNSGLRVGFIALFLSHGFSFVMNFLYRDEYQRVSASDLVMAPYRRVVILHVTIIFGAFLGLLVGFPTGLVALLVLIKIGVDLALHLKERQTGAILPRFWRT